jgi:hypothetical protein
MPAYAMRGHALQTNLCSEGSECLVCLCNLDFAEKRLEQPQHVLNPGVSFGDPFEVVDLAVAFDTTAEQALQSEEHLRHGAGRAVLCR